MKLCDLKMVTISCKQSAISMDGGVTDSSLTVFLPFFGLLGQFWSGLNNAFGWMVGYVFGGAGGCDGEGVWTGHSPDWSQFWRNPCGNLLQTRQPHGEAVCRGKVERNR